MRDLPGGAWAIVLGVPATIAIMLVAARLFGDAAVMTGMIVPMSIYFSWVQRRYQRRAAEARGEARGRPERAMTAPRRGRRAAYAFLRQSVGMEFLLAPPGRLRRVVDPRVRAAELPRAVRVCAALGVVAVFTALALGSSVVGAVVAGVFAVVISILLVRDHLDQRRQEHPERRREPG